MSEQTEVPTGSAQTVLDWVDNDPQRAQTALEAEQCNDSPRSTLVTKLEAIIAKEEAPVSDQTATTSESQVDETGADQGTDRFDDRATAENQATVDPSQGGAEGAEDQRTEAELQEQAGLAPGPEQPKEVELYPQDHGTVLLPTALRDPDVELDDEGIGSGSARAVQERKEDEREKREGDWDSIEAEQAESLEAAISGAGAVISVNGTAYAFNKDMIGSLKQVVDKTVIGLAL